ncbi:Thymidylate kinase [Pseudovibrio axinellae]|uniref:Thymidylate kinase n=1 Tax=Pseudovibrio axinellae TaxID=989403 RepID=A0A165XHP1_9HYPH|nr:dTMP kinase [Pseudovibrio axinellae]KZL17710.1 Thymidylate kinase [Pseudovibrio axinellae]SER42735.1 thymidylate kinase [Pseudovibrio axinellae]
MSGIFISFEGGEGAGKSTQIQRLRDKLASKGIETIVTREPGGSQGAELVREVLLSGAAKKYGVTAEAILFAAARADHIDTLIKPALQDGKWVLCDRFADSSRVYQGESGVPSQTVEALQQVAIAGHNPDMTLLINVTPEVGLTRVSKRTAPVEFDGPDRFETDTLETHRRRQKIFLELADKEPERIVVIDGDQPQDNVTDDIWQAVQRRFASVMENSTTDQLPHEKG